MPIVNENDTVSVEQIRFGDNDTLAALVACLVEADLMVILSDIEGLFDANPHFTSRGEAHRPRRGHRPGDHGRGRRGGHHRGLGRHDHEDQGRARAHGGGHPAWSCATGGAPEPSWPPRAGEDVGTRFVAAKQAPRDYAEEALDRPRRRGARRARGRRRREGGARRAGGARFCRWACARWKAASRRATSWTSRTARGTCSPAARRRSRATRPRSPSAARARELQANRLLASLADKPLVHRDELIVFE